MTTALVPETALRDSPAPARAAAAGWLPLLDRCAVFALGFSLQFNVILSTFGLPFMRLSDAVPFALLPYFCLRTDFLARAWDSATRIALVLGLLMASVVLKADQGPGDVYMTLILMVYFVQALQILMVFDDRLLTVLCAGILIGYFASLPVLVAAGAGVNLEAYGLAVPIDGVSADLVLFMQDKLGGLWASGNQTGHIFAAAGAVAFCLSMQFRSKAVYLLYLGGLLVSFPLTNNRAGLIVPLIASIVLLRAGVKNWHILMVVSALGLLALYTGITGSYPLPASMAEALEKRFYSDANVDNNIFERFESAAEAVGVILRHPFGIGNVAMENELYALTGITTPHNGIISFGQQSGVLLALLYLVSVVGILIGRWRDYGWFVYLTVVFSTPSMFFEQLTATQYFLFVVAIVLAAWVVRGARPRSQTG